MVMSPNVITAERASRVPGIRVMSCDGAELLDPLRRIAPHSPRAADHLVAVLILLVDEHDRVLGERDHVVEPEEAASQRGTPSGRLALTDRADAPGSIAVTRPVDAVQLVGGAVDRQLSCPSACLGKPGGVEHDTTELALVMTGLQGRRYFAGVGEIKADVVGGIVPTRLQDDPHLLETLDDLDPVRPDSQIGAVVAQRTRGPEHHDVVAIAY